MSTSLVPFSSLPASAAPVPPVRSVWGGGAVTGPSAARARSSTDPAEVLRSAIRQAVLRDLRRLGEVLHEPCSVERHVLLRRHVQFLLSELDPGWPLVRRLRHAVGIWRPDFGQDTVREVLFELEAVLTPPEDGGDAPVTYDRAPRMFVAAGRPQLSLARSWWLLDGLDEPEATTVRGLLTGPRRLVAVLSRGREQRRQRLLWN